MGNPRSTQTGETVVVLRLSGLTPNYNMRFRLLRLAGDNLCQMLGVLTVGRIHQRIIKVVTRTSPAAPAMGLLTAHPILRKQPVSHDHINDGHHRSPNSFRIPTNAQ